MAALSQEVVVMRALGLGDLITSIPALRAIRRHFLTARVTLITAPALAELALREGFTDQVLGLNAVRALPPELPRQISEAIAPGAVAVNLHGVGPQSTRLLESMRPRMMIASAERRVHEPETRRCARVLEEHGIECDPDDQQLRSASPARERIAVVHPGASAPARRWPGGRWASVARELADRGFDVYVTAGPKERGLARAVAGSAHHSRCRRWSGAVCDLVDLVARSSIVASGDTGVAHVAYATSTPSVTLFGPTPPSTWGPTIDRELHRVIWHGDFSDPQADEPSPGLLDVSPEEVIEMLDTLPVAVAA